MKKLFNQFRTGHVGLLLLMLACAIFGVGSATAMTADVITPAGGGAVDTNATTTVTDTRENSENLLLDTIDKMVAKIRPYNVVLDTISRHVADTKTSNQQTVRHYAIDVIDLTAKVSTEVTAGTTQAALETTNDSIFCNDQTIIVPSVLGYLEDGTTQDVRPLQLYVIGKNNSNNPLVVPINGKKTGNVYNTLPTIPAEAKLIRAGRAGSETQLQTDAYSAVPTDWTQYLQKFMAQIEESTMMKIADKEVDWTFSDQEEEAVFDMRRVQNVSYWLGTKKMLKLKNSRASKAEETYFTEGIWFQAGREFDFEGETVTAKNLVSLMKHAFTGNASAKQKLIICGSDVLEAFEQVEYTKTVYVGSKSQAYGLEFNSIISKFGTLLAVHDQTLDDMEMAGCALILDADFLRKWTMGWKVQDFDFKTSGAKDVDGRSLIETAGLVLKNPNAHSRVYLDKTPQA